MQVLLLVGPPTSTISIDTPTADELAAALHGGGAVVWFGLPGSPLTRQLTPDDFDSNGVPDSSLGLRQLSETTGGCSVSYRQAQEKRTNSGRTMSSRTDVVGEEFRVGAEFLSLANAAGGNLRYVLSGGKIGNGVIGQNTSPEYGIFPVVFVCENQYSRTGTAAGIVVVLFAAICEGFDFEASDDAFTVCKAEFFAQLSTNHAIGAAQIFSI